MRLPDDPESATFAVFSRGIAGIPHLGAFLGASKIVFRPSDALAETIDWVVGWGYKQTAKMARQFAEKHELPYLRLEDGFLRSVGLGVEGHAPLSLVIDDIGIYYDATRESRLERMLNHPDTDDPLRAPELLQRSSHCIKQLVQYGLSKYNYSSTVPVSLTTGTHTSRVLVIDQTKGDMSILRGMANASTFRDMLEAALDENPQAEIYVKTHPDVLTGKKSGHFGSFEMQNRVHMVSNNVNPTALIGQMDRIYTVSSQMGFEALLCGKPVTCFGVPFYAGWGLTDDRQQTSRRTRRRTIEQLFGAAYVLYPRYVDPSTGRRCEIENIIEHLTLQRRLFSRNTGHFFCVGFSCWKRNHVRSYLKSPDSRISFVRTAKQAIRKGFDSDSKLVVWGMRDGQDIGDLSRRSGVPIWRMEDGFLRSVGLGSDLTAPLSLVVDRNGIYYDPSVPSELELILESSEFTTEEIDRARRLIEKIVLSGVSKYNVGGKEMVDISSARSGPVVLVPGQVEDDSSIQLGCIDIRTNEALLDETRRVRPTAHIIYKPHPDVLSGNRRGVVRPEVLDRACNQIVEDVPLARCLELVEEVHTMSSLVGFEALLRGLPVFVYGRPFYSGWGLTTDRHKLKRRTKRLSIDELVAGVLLRYPRYLNRETGEFTHAETIVDCLKQRRDSLETCTRIKSRWHQRQLRKLSHLWKGLLNVR